MLASVIVKLERLLSLCVDVFSSKRNAKTLRGTMRKWGIPKWAAAALLIAIIISSLFRYERYGDTFHHFDRWTGKPSSFTSSKVLSAVAWLGGAYCALSLVIPQRKNEKDTDDHE